MRRSGTIREDQRGATLMEFGLVAPVIMMFLMGAFDVGHRLYVRSVLQGAIQKAARDAGLEGGAVAEQQAAIDAAVLTQVRPLHDTATVTFERRAYRSFERAASPAEPFTDTDEDGECNHNEPFEDLNNNGSRDLDIGVTGQGGAQDAVIYGVRMQYDAITPVGEVIGIDDHVDIRGQTVLRNQPYNEQGSDAAPGIGNCI